MKMWPLFPVLVAAVLSPPPARAQDLAKAFDDAVDALKQSPRGTCDGIPYTDLREECRRKAEEVAKWCKSGPDYEGPRRCSSTMDPKDTQQEIEMLKQRRDIARESKENLERRMSSLTDDAAKRAVEDSIKQADRTIEDAARAQEALEKDVKDATRRISDRVEEWTYCREYRERVFEVFDKALSRVKSESDTTVAQRKQDLVRLLEGTLPGHREQIENVRNTIETCKQMLYDIGRLGDSQSPNAPDAPLDVDDESMASIVGQEGVTQDVSEGARRSGPGRARDRRSIDHEAAEVGSSLNLRGSPEARHVRQARDRSDESASSHRYVPSAHSRRHGLRPSWGHGHPLLVALPLAPPEAPRTRDDGAGDGRIGLDPVVRHTSTTMPPRP